MTAVKAYLLAAASGVLYAIANERSALCGLAFVALVPLWCALELYARSTRHALRIGLCAGLAVHLLAYRWLLPTIHEFAGLPFAASAFVWGALMLYQAVQLALCSAAIAHMRARGWSLAWSAPIAFGAFEQLYPMEFPSPFAASLHALPSLLQSAELAGTLPLSMLLVLCNAAVAGLACARIRKQPLAPWLRLAAASALIWGALALHGSMRMTQVRSELARAPSLLVGVVQANIAPHEKRRDHAGTLRKHIALSRELVKRVNPDLLIWPETALPGLLPASSRQLFLPLPSHTPLLTGAVVHRVHHGQPELFNSALLLDSEQRVLARSDKLRLVPFAERLPFGELLPQLYDLVPGAGHLTPGSRPVALQLNGHRIAALVCYEDILPDLVREVMSATQAELLVNVTNDAWFGDTPAPHYHLALSVLRTIEQRRFLVRATNSGVSAVVDPTGVVLQATPTFQRASLHARVALLTGTTVFQTIGDAAGYATIASCLLLMILRRARPAGLA